MKPHQTLRTMCVHPKDKHEVKAIAGVLYQILYVRISKLQYRETKGRYGTWEKEHTRDVNSVEEVKLSRSRKKDSLKEVNPSARMEHVAQTNYTISWGSVRRPMKEDAWITWGTKETISIRKTWGLQGLPAFRGLLQVTAMVPFWHITDDGDSFFWNISTVN